MDRSRIIVLAAAVALLMLFGVASAIRKPAPFVPVTSPTPVPASGATATGTPAVTVPSPESPPIARPTCAVGGCSGQLCVDEALGPAVSTCEYREEYACYRKARCEAQRDGRCGWTQTDELRRCIDDANG